MQKQFLIIILMICTAGVFIAACTPGVGQSQQAEAVAGEATSQAPDTGSGLQAGVADPAPSSTPETQDVAQADPEPTATLVEQAQPEPAAILPSPTADESPAFNCSAPVELTPAQTEGPYYTPNTPQRNSLLEEGMPGTRLVLEGFVLTADCQPIAGAWIDFWQADASGVYDNQGYTLRGHQFSDERGAYRLETVVPGEYPGRPPHIHVKVQAPGGPVLTTQVYFPGAGGNQTDRIFNPALLVQVESQGEQMIDARFDFVIAP